MRLKKQLLDSDGSSMISVLVAFVILLIGIGGFSRAVTTANDMVRRSEMLNAATGDVLDQFYSSYAEAPVGKNYVLDVYSKGDGTGTAPVFKLNGRMRVREYTVNVTPPGSGSEEGEAGSETITYSMYFYK